jgi:hypothetical protein
MLIKDYVKSNRTDYKDVLDKITSLAFDTKMSKKERIDIFLSQAPHIK